MYFFAEQSGVVTQSTPLGSWDVSGYQQVNVHAWVRGATGSVYMETYFNQLSAAQEKLTIGPVGPGGWNIATITRTYPVFAPTLSILLYNPSTQMDFRIRLYAACCEPKPGGLSLAASRLAQLFGRSKAAADGEAHRALGREVDAERLLRGPEEPGSESAS